MLRIRNMNDVLSGVFLIAVAILALVLSWNLRIGTALNMGPGYVPKLLCFIQMAFGVALVALGFLVPGDQPQPWSLRPILWILASVTFFGLAIERFGLVTAVVGVVILSTFAHRGTRPAEAAILAVALAGFSVMVFVTALGLPIPTWPPALVR